MKQIILSNGRDTAILREELNTKGNKIIVSIVNGRKREHNCTSLDWELNAYTFTDMKIVDEMTYEIEKPKRSTNERPSEIASRR